MASPPAQASSTPSSPLHPSLNFSVSQQTPLFVPPGLPAVDPRDRVQPPDQRLMTGARFAQFKPSLRSRETPQSTSEIYPLPPPTRIPPVEEHRPLETLETQSGQMAGMAGMAGMTGVVGMARWEGMTGMAEREGITEEQVETQLRSQRRAERKRLRREREHCDREAQEANWEQEAGVPKTEMEKTRQRLTKFGGWRPTDSKL